MATVPHNQAKNVTTMKGARKAGVYTWGDDIATWGDILATWGNFTIAPQNQAKPTLSPFLELQNKVLFTLQNGQLLDFQGGSASAVYVNQSKN